MIRDIQQPSNQQHTYQIHYKSQAKCLNIWTREVQNNISHFSPVYFTYSHFLLPTSGFETYRRIYCKHDTNNTDKEQYKTQLLQKIYRVKLFKESNVNTIIVSVVIAISQFFYLIQHFCFLPVFWECYYRPIINGTIFFSLLYNRLQIRIR